MARAYQLKDFEVLSKLYGQSALDDSRATADYPTGAALFFGFTPHEIYFSERTVLGGEIIPITSCISRNLLLLARHIRT